jgi:hypothetical protein
MNRRGFLGSIFAAAFAPVIPAAPVAPQIAKNVLPPGEYFMDIEAVKLYPYQRQAISIMFKHKETGRIFESMLNYT